jgi:hypothetical protein
MKIDRATSADFANLVLNHSSVRDDVADPKSGKIDVSAIIDSPAHMILQAQHGILFFARIFEGIWETHAAILPEGRGEWAVEFCREGQIYMFCQTDCVEILTRIPVPHKASKALAVRSGFLYRWTRPSCVWRGTSVPYNVWSRTLQEWAVDYQIDDIADEMKAHGLVRKAVAWYNRYAALSREPLMTEVLN